MNVRSFLPSLWERDERTPRPFESLRREIDRTFDDFYRGFRMPEIGGFGLVPDMDVHESGDKVTLNVELPGVDENDIDISVSDRTVTISGEKKSEIEKKDADNYRSERSFGSFQRSLSLPFKIDADKVEAKFVKGVLTVTVPKPADAVEQTKKVAITS